MSGGSRTLRRGLAVLDALRAAPAGATVAGLSASTGLDRAVLYRLLETLMDRGMVDRDDRRCYHLGVGLIPLGAAAAGRLRIGRLAGPVLHELSARVGEAACLSVVHAHHMVVVARHEAAERFVRVAYDVGDRHTLRTGAHGRVVLAHRDPLAESTPWPVELTADLKRIRADGYAVSTSEIEAGTIGVAAPVLAADGAAVASVGVVAPASRVTDATDFVAPVTEAAERLSTLLAEELASADQ